MGLHISSKIRSGILNWVVSVSCRMVSVSCRMVFVHLSIGSEAVPEGIIARISNLEMQPLWDSGKDNSILKRPLNLLAMTVGLKQKEIVDKIVEKSSAWSSCVVLVSAINQTKWWFVKRFLHPDIVAEYIYVFLWDEDLLVLVDNIDTKRYLSIVIEEARQAAWLLCTGNLLAPQEPIHFLPNPSNVVVIHLSTIFQGDCMRNIGVVYSEYIVHLGPLGDSIGNEASPGKYNCVLILQSLIINKGFCPLGCRCNQTPQEIIELKFSVKGGKMQQGDKCWIDSHEQANKTSH
ncbi:hypothetical protein D0Y65_034607 [Glycine soja]|uniref:Uncharacterized protein n=1 Tax=Glycine soja TaxID=3848 RepID=A0A445HR78_GLYSO|nr:hypothetical protein D0Y65_034607 [Glycine soja]